MAGVELPRAGLCGAVGLRAFVDGHGGGGERWRWWLWAVRGAQLEVQVWVKAAGTAVGGLDISTT